MENGSKFSIDEILVQLSKNQKALEDAGQNLHDTAQQIEAIQTKTALEAVGGNLSRISEAIQELIEENRGSER